MLCAQSVGAAQPLYSGGHWAKINGHPLYYQVLGAGRPLLLLHGGGDSGSHSFHRQIKAFARQHELILPDQVGQGRTPDVPGPLSYLAMMQDTVALLERLHLKEVDLVGFSDGGILALMLAVRHPELVGRVIISGVNIAPDGLTEDAREGFRAMPDDDDSDPVYAKLRQLWLSSPTSAELNLAMLATIQDQVLVMSGDRDAISLEHTLTIYRAIPKAQLCVLPDTEHETFLDRPEWLNPIVLGFLARQ